MPSFDRLLVIAVLALSAAVRSAPAETNHDYGIVLSKDGLMSTDIAPTPPSADKFYKGHINVDLGGHDVDGDGDLDGDDHDVDARDFDEGDVGIDRENVGIDKENIGIDRENVKATEKDAALDRHAAEKATAAPKPKTTKAAGTAKLSACIVKVPAKKPRAFTPRAYDAIAHLFTRDNEEFIGWHGTNSDTAALWAAKGYIQKPVKPDGFLDYIGIGKGTVKGTSGANAELGPGLYVSDTKDTSLASAAFNAQKNPGTTGALCAIFAKSSGNWRNVIRKAFIPEDIVGDTPEKEALRVAHIQRAVPGVSQTTVIRFALLNRLTGKETGQLLIPEVLATQFSARCFKVDGIEVAKSDEAASKVGTVEFLNYKGDQIRTAWKIVPEHAGEAEAQYS